MGRKIRGRYREWSEIAERVGYELIELIEVRKGCWFMAYAGERIIDPFFFFFS